MRRTLTVMIMIIALAMSTMAAESVDESLNTDSDFAVEYLAAPAVAGLLLEEAGIDNRYGTGKEGGNFMRDVAYAMGDTTDFNGISKTDVIAYECAVAAFLVDQGAPVTASGTGVLDAAASGAVAMDNANGTTTLAITVIDQCGDPIAELNPLSDFYVTDSVIPGQFYFGTSAIPGSEAGAWTEADGTYSVTLERNFFNARPAGYDDGWFRIWDIYVSDELVEDELQLQTTYWAVGDWKLDLFVGSTANARFIIIETHVEGEIDGFFGIGYDPVTDEITGEITGTIDGQNITMYYERTDIVTDYTATLVGTIADDGDSMSGTWSDSGSNVGQTWAMVRQ